MIDSTLLNHYSWLTEIPTSGGYKQPSKVIYYMIYNTAQVISYMTYNIAQPWGPINWMEPPPYNQDWMSSWSLFHVRSNADIDMFPQRY